MDIKHLLDLAIKAAEEASKKILNVYTSDNSRTETKGDQSPLTLADQQAHLVISEILQSSDLPIVSEEGKNIPFAIRKNWEYFWMVDPLDGTKEFIKKNGEFTVNIALIEKQTPILGIVSVPVSGEVYFGGKEIGALKKYSGIIQQLQNRGKMDLTAPGIRIVASRSHMNEETMKFITSFESPSLVSSGSSLKFMLLATGHADIYPRFAPTMEWDTAAAHAIIKAVGLNINNVNNRELAYNKENLLNPHFIAGWV